MRNSLPFLQNLKILQIEGMQFKYSSVKEIVVIQNHSFWDRILHMTFKSVMRQNDQAGSSFVSQQMPKAAK